MNLDFSLEAPAAARTVVYDGPPLLIPGYGCRLQLKTSSEAEGRDDDARRRLFELAVAMRSANVPGFYDSPADGTMRLQGGSEPLYVKGATETHVLSTIGQALLKAPQELKSKASELGIDAIMVW